MFLTLNDMIDDEKKIFVLKALHKELRDVANEAELIFVKYKKSNCYIDVMKIFRSRREKIAKTTKQPFAKDGLKIPIPYKMMALHDTIEIILDGLCLKIFLMEKVFLRGKKKRTLKLA